MLDWILKAFEGTASPTHLVSLCGIQLKSDTCRRTPDNLLTDECPNQPLMQSLVGEHEFPRGWVQSFC